MQESEHGVILFSLGSILGFDHLPKGHLEVFKKAFGQLKERVLWKFDRKVDNLTENVKIARWIPQGDVLGSPHLICIALIHFIRLSTFEQLVTWILINRGAELTN